MALKVPVLKSTSYFEIVSSCLHKWLPFFDMNPIPEHYLNNKCKVVPLVSHKILGFLHPQNTG